MLIPLRGEPMFPVGWGVRGSILTVDARKQYALIYLSIANICPYKPIMADLPHHDGIHRAIAQYLNIGTRKARKASISPQSVTPYTNIGKDIERAKAGTNAAQARTDGRRRGACEML